MVYRPTARVLSVLELLQSYGQLTGPELAARLEVNVRTVRRYIVTLQDIGVPIESDIGRYGGYALHPGFKLPPLMFSDDEVLVLSLGLLLARRSGLAEAGAAVESALAKVERVLPLALAERLRALVETLQLDAAPPDSPIAGEVLARLSLANRQQRQVMLTYLVRGTVTQRLVDPYAIIHHEAQWYTVGYCHLRRAVRIFRLDRVQSVTLSEATFTPSADFDALEYMLDSFQAIPDRWDVEVLLETSLEEARLHIPRTLATLAQEEGGLRLRASIRDLNAMARTLITLGCPVKVINPRELRAEFLVIAVQITQFAHDDEAESHRQASVTA